MSEFERRPWKVCAMDPETVAAIRGWSYLNNCRVAEAIEEAWNFFEENADSLASWIQVLETTLEEHTSAEIDGGVVH